MNPFLLERDERLSDWKEFRKHLPTLDRKTQLEELVSYWSKAPLLKHHIDAYDLGNAPSPWEMIAQGDWCRDAVAVGMEFTLRLSGWDSDQLNLVFIKDYDLSEQVLLLKLDSGETLNYCFGEITEYPQTDHEVIATWRHNGRSYSKI